MMKKCVFFDRDGIINEKPVLARYIRCWEEFKLMPEFIESLRIVKQKGYVAVIVTNQKGIWHGVMSQESVDEIHNNMRACLRNEHELELLDVFVCPHGDDQCDCRKPLPGMIVRAAGQHDIDLSASWMIGDSHRDIDAGNRAGCRTILVDDSDGGGETEPLHQVARISELPSLLEKVL